MSRVKQILIPNQKPSATTFKTDEIIINPVDGEAYIKNNQNDVLKILSLDPDDSVTHDGDITLQGDLFIPNLTTVTSATTYLRYKADTGQITYSTGGSQKLLKQNIITINDKNSPLTTDIFSSLNPVTFKYKIDLNNTTGGFIAEEIAKVNPLLASWGPDYKIDTKGNITKELNSDKIVPVDIDDRAILALCVAKIQELEAEIKELKSKLP